MQYCMEQATYHEQQASGDNFIINAGNDIFYCSKTYSNQYHQYVHNSQFIQSIK